MPSRFRPLRHFEFTWYLTILLPLVFAGTTWGQGTVADYERARGLRALTAKTVFLSNVKPHWFDQSKRFWYRNDLPGDQRSFILVDVETGTRRSAFDHTKLGQAIAEETKKTVDPLALPISQLDFTDETEVVTFSAFGQRWRCDLNTYALSKAEAGDPQSGNTKPPRNRSRGRSGGSQSRGKSPDGKWEIVVKDHNLILRDLVANEESPLTDDGTEKDGYESRIYWSPDSRKMVAMRTKPGGDRKVYLIESSPKDQLQPKLHSYNYLKPGDAIRQTTPRLFDIASRREIPVDTGLFSNPWSVGQIRWQPDSRRLTFVYNQRGHQVLRVVAIDADTGETAALVDEVSATFFDYANKQFSRFFDATHEIIWMSERDGWNHLYLIDSRTGDVKNQITQGEWIVRGVDRVDEEERQIWFRAAGGYPEHGPE